MENRLVKLVPFEPEHMFHVVNRDSNILQEYQLHVDKRDRGPAFTVMDDEAIIGCAGIMMMWPGVGIAWCAFGSEIGKYRIWITDHVTRVLRDTIRTFKLHRVEAVVLADNQRNIDWIEMLGFTKEKDIAQKYTSDKKDVVRYEYIP